MNKHAHKAAGMASSKAALNVGRVIAPVWVVPALAVNLDWSVDASLPWNVAAAGSIFATAALVEAARHMKTRTGLALCVMLASVLFLNNVQNGFRNASHRSGDIGDHRRVEIETARHAASFRVQLVQSRTGAVQVAGETPASAIRAQMEQAISGNARRWRATAACDPLQITAGASMVFCSTVASLKAKLGAAERRDDLDGKIVALDLRREQEASPAVADPFSDNAAAVLRGLGVPIAVGAENLIGIFGDALRAIIPELIAAFLPAFWLSLVDRYVRHGTPSESRTASQRLDSRHGPTTPQTSQSTPAAIVGPFSRFVGEMLERAPGAKMTPKEVWELWENWCASKGRNAESQRWLGLRLGRTFEFDAKNKRKFYLDVQEKRSAAGG